MSPDPKPPLNTAVDIDGLHRLLWRRSDRRNVVRVHQGDLAAEILVSKYTMSRLFRRLQDEGRIRKHSTAKLNIASYEVVDPAVWANTRGGRPEA
jgi:hypothetical protein